MICDIHVHLVAGAEANHGNFLSPRLMRSWGGRMLARQFGGGDPVQTTLAWLDASLVDQAVLLALDGAYREDGSPDPSNTLLVTDNDFIADIAAKNRKTLFGASVHPFRRDALPEMERFIEKGACLVKWLPGAQNIQPEHPRCFAFYDLLARHKIPLLTHTGAEHTLNTFPNSLNDPERLTPALERGVTVIAAHCGTSLYLHEKSYFRCWREMALRHENFYGDISAFGVITRIWLLNTLLRSPQLAAKCVYGSDFPAVPMPLGCLGKIGLKEALEIRRAQNPFDQSVLLMKAAGVPGEIFAKAGTLLRIPQGNRAGERISAEVLAA